jgi:hypothetical protein
VKRGTNGTNHREAMQQATMKTLTPPSVWDIKQVKITKFKKFVPENYQADPIYRMPDGSVIKLIKDQKNQKVRDRANKNKKARKKRKEEENSKEEDSKKGNAYNIIV